MLESQIEMCVFPDDVRLELSNESSKNMNYISQHAFLGPCTLFIYYLHTYLHLFIYIYLCLHTYYLSGLEVYYTCLSLYEVRDHHHISLWSDGCISE